MQQLCLNSQLLKRDADDPEKLLSFINALGSEILTNCHKFGTAVKQIEAFRALDENFNLLISIKLHIDAGFSAVYGS
jgi:hypothetical protein